MGPIDALWHLLNFFIPAVGVGCLGAAAVKLLWRRGLPWVWPPWAQQRWPLIMPSMP